MIMAQNAHASIGVLIKAMWLRPIVTKKCLFINYRCGFSVCTNFGGKVISAIMLFQGLRGAIIFILIIRYRSANQSGLKWMIQRA
jgi:hypothetical protein